MNNRPLVTIVVITYNSSKYILETLESVKTQTYQNIELIISDDHSSDNTIEICKNWIENNAKLFKNIKLLISDKNTGVAANCNRGFKNSCGVWIKAIAGDDLLTKDGIERFILTYSGKAFLVEGDVLSFYVNENGCKIYEPQSLEIDKSFYNKSAEFQYKKLLLKNIIKAPGLMISRDMFIKCGGFDEDIPFIEDWPFLLNCLSKGYCIDRVNIPMALYRKENNSLSNSFNNRFYTSYKLLISKYILPNLPWYSFRRVYLCLQDLKYRYSL